ncbi:extracellular solute-binding protein [Amycolatopsis acidiphila]|uniref:extracellular solute-binding protein n=1 Tax=Amycolatopsis acidiphila TaxID=715473 RepID=UPI001643AF03|nr:extracellular solute-binding protein [Amycolatopsis acidiphila]UIJ62381.1 extracellular solute-binding protein [Amycolatopsis acidiphila]GHG83361.1 ABC transporter substrate-binding protein [Amycolatopsis acidiphila]
MARRGRALILAVAVVLAAAVTAACSPPSLSAAPEHITPRKPGHPITLTLLDGSGDLQVYQKIYNDFAKAHPELVSGIRYETASSPDVLGKLRAQELSNHVDTSLILGGTDIVGALQQQKLLTPLLPDHQDLLPDLSKIQDPPRAKLQALVGGAGIMNLWSPSGPAWEYDTKHVPALPGNPQELLAWAKANPGKFTYAQPPNSGPGRQFMMSLPYELGDANPADPVNGWTRTWDYLRELGRYVAAYPASSTIMNKQLADGSVWIVPTSTASDFNNHRQNVWGPDADMGILADQAWIMDGHFMLVPRGVSPETLYVDLAFISWVLQPQQQVRTYESGTISPAVTDAPLTQAGDAGKAAVAKFGRPDFLAQAFRTGTVNAPLDPLVLRTAFDLWQRKIGSHVGE